MLHFTWIHLANRRHHVAFIHC